MARTATTSLHLAFGQLGFRSAPSSVELMELMDDPDADLAVLKTFDAFTDNPVPFVFRALDQRFPDAKFVLTTRPVGDWLRSMEWLFGEGLDRLKPTRELGDQVHERLYGITNFDADILADIYTRHHSAVERHFAARPSDLLKVSIADLGWPILCGFLDVDEPVTSFPHSNSSDPTAVSWSRRRFFGGGARARRRGRSVQ